jgi:hypothetical protein
MALVRIIAAMCERKDLAGERVGLPPEHERPVHRPEQLEHFWTSRRPKQPLAGKLDAGGMLKIDIRPPVSLSNKGGIITLLNDQGLKVHGGVVHQGASEIIQAGPSSFNGEWPASDS